MSFRYHPQIPILSLYKATWHSIDDQVMFSTKYWVVLDLKLYFWCLLKVERY